MSVTTITAKLTDMADLATSWFGDVVVCKHDDDKFYFLLRGGDERVPSAWYYTLDEAVQYLNKLPEGAVVPDPPSDEDEVTGGVGWPD